MSITTEIKYQEESYYGLDTITLPDGTTYAIALDYESANEAARKWLVSNVYKMNSAGIAKRAASGAVAQSCMAQSIDILQDTQGLSANYAIIAMLGENLEDYTCSVAATEAPEYFLSSNETALCAEQFTEDITDYLLDIYDEYGYTPYEFMEYAQFYLVG